MPRRPQIAVLAALALLAAACQPPAPDGLYRAELAVFGTRVEIVIRDAEPATAESVVGEISRRFRDMHRRWHPWEPGGLREINHAIAEARPVAIDDDVAGLIRRGRRLEQQSEGLFNPAIGGLLALWGFHADTRPAGPPPDPAEIAAWVEAAPSLTDLVLDGNRLTSRNRAVRLDFNAQAKGRAVDEAVAILRQAGIEHAIVNAGGDLRAIGERGDRRWRAGVRHPDGDGGRILATLEVGDGEAVFTSGNYERYREDEGIRRGHILDPRTGHPVEHIRSVTVIHDNGEIADAAATALAVAGAAEWRGIARKMGIEQVMRVDENGRIEWTDAMRERTRLQSP